MKDFVEYIVKHIIDNIENFSVSVKTSDDKKEILLLKVNPEEVGKVIGKHGKTVQAFRTLLTAASTKYGKHVILEVTT